MSRKQIALLVGVMTALYISIGLRVRRRRNHSEQKINATELRGPELSVESLDKMIDATYPRVGIGPELIIAIALAGWWAGLFNLVLNITEPEFAILFGYVVSLDALKWAFVFLSVTWIQGISNFVVQWRKSTWLLENLDVSIKPTKVPSFYRGVNYAYPLMIVIVTAWYGVITQGIFDIPSYWIWSGPLLLISWLSLDYVVLIILTNNKALKILAVRRKKREAEKLKFTRSN